MRNSSAVAAIAAISAVLAFLSIGSSISGISGTSGRKLASLSCQIAEDAPLTLDLIESLRSGPCRADTVEKIVPLLPRKLRINATFVYQSAGFSSKCVDEQHPRVILFTNDAKFIFTFPWRAVTEPASHCSLLEMTEWSEERDELVPQAVGLSPPARKTLSRISGGAQNVCLTCHGPQMRPIWPGNYPQWTDQHPSLTRVYGSQDDTLIAYPHVYADAPEDNEYRIDRATREYAGFRSFYHSVLDAGRASWFFWDPARRMPDPAAFPELAARTLKQIEARDEERPKRFRPPELTLDPFPYQLRAYYPDKTTLAQPRPNLRLGKALAVLNGRRVGKLMTPNGKLTRAHYGLLHRVYQCFDLPAYYAQRKLRWDGDVLSPFTDERTAAMWRALGAEPRDANLQMIDRFGKPGAEVSEYFDGEARAHEYVYRALIKKDPELTAYFDFGDSAQDQQAARYFYADRPDYTKATREQGSRAQIKAKRSTEAYSESDRAPLCRYLEAQLQIKSN